MAPAAVIATPRADSNWSELAKAARSVCCPENKALSPRLTFKALMAVSSPWAACRPKVSTLSGGWPDAAVRKAGPKADWSCTVFSAFCMTSAVIWVSAVTLRYPASWVRLVSIPAIWEKFPCSRAVWSAAMPVVDSLDRVCSTALSRALCRFRIRDCDRSPRLRVCILHIQQGLHHIPHRLQNLGVGRVALFNLQQALHFKIGIHAALRLKPGKGF